MMKKNISYLILFSLCGILLVIPIRAGGGSTTNDAFYQNIYDDTILKTFFLKRIANDISPLDPSFFDSQNPYASQTADMPQGIFLHTENADDLDALFQAIGRRIQLRLVR